MNAAHVRPMSAYIGLCAAAAFVVAHGLSVAPGAGPTGIARAGEPAMLVTESITLSVVDSLADLGAGVAGAIVPGVAEVPAAALGDSTAAGSAAAAATRTSSGSAPRTTVRRAVTLTPATAATSHRSAGGKHRSTGAGSAKRAEAPASPARALSHRH
jgi:hypothetical protein